MGQPRRDLCCSPKVHPPAARSDLAYSGLGDSLVTFAGPEWVCPRCLSGAEKLSLRDLGLGVRSLPGLL